MPTTKFLTMKDVLTSIAKKKKKLGVTTGFGIPPGPTPLTKAQRAQIVAKLRQAAHNVH